MKVRGEVKIVGQIYSFTRISLLSAIFFIAGILISGSCTKINEFTIGNDFVEPQTKLTIVDTFRVDLSTVLLDSIITSSQGNALVGNYKDMVFGSVKCNSYFDLAYQTFESLEEKAVYDSAAFVFKYSGYYYGDTLPQMALAVHQLTELIVPFPNTSLYNNSYFDYSPEALGSVQFFPSPGSKTDTTVSIPVNAFGEELFSLIKNKNANVSSEEAFNDFLKGFILVSSSDENKAVIGLTADKENMSLKFYYHVDQEFPEDKSIALTMGETNHQFNNVRYDFSGTPLENLKADNSEVKSSQTGNKIYLQGLTGILAKFKFPTVQNLLMEQRWKILKAELVFEPANGSYNAFSLPQRLYLYETDNENRFSLNSYVKDSEGRPILPEFEYDQFFNEDTRYTFEITSYLNRELADDYFDPEHALLISPETSKFQSTLDRLVIEGKNPRVKLRVYYLTY